MINPINKLKTLFNKKSSQNLATAVVSKPIVGGERVSEATGVTTTLGSLIREQMISTKDSIIEFAGVIEYLCKFNPDFSLALENIVSLASTKFDVVVEEGDTKTSGNTLSELKQAQNNWYKYSGGVDSMRDDICTQLVINGCASFEMIPNESLDGIKKIALVPPSTIRFKYDSVTDEYVPYQIGVRGNYIKLNPETYRYYAHRRMGEVPYATPPFLAALDNVVIEKNMMDNMREIIKNLGVMGFMEVLLTAPQRNLGRQGGVAETETEYKFRLQNLLAEAKVEIQKGMSNGYLIGFKGLHEFEMKATTANVEGAASLIQNNNEMKMAGLHQSPFLLGRNYSTTETLGKVVLAILSAQVQSFQRLIDKSLADMYMLHLELKGFKNNQITVVSGKPLTNDENKEQLTFSSKIDNYEKLYQQGIISQEQKAQALGYSSAYLEGALGNNEENIVDVEYIKEDDEFIQYYNNYKEFEYEDQNDFDKQLSFAEGNDSLVAALKEYSSATNINYDKALDKVMKSLGKALEQETILTSDNILGKIFYTLYGRWETDFTLPQIKIIKKHITDAYKIFRSDKGIFGATSKKIPDSVFSTIDARTIEYMKTLDRVYLGKFISDEGTTRKITGFVKETYLEKGYDLRSKASIDRFTKKFKGVLKGEAWKIDQVLSTTVSRMRYQAGIHYLQQAKVTKYIRRSIGDRLRCGYCEILDSKTYSVTKTVESINKVLNNDVEDIEQIQPFVTSVYKDFNDLKGLTVSEIQDKEIEGVPSHPHCRCTIVADI